MVEKNPLDLYFDMKEGRIKLAQKAEDSGAISLLNGYLAILRTLVIIFQHGHWKCKGSNFYGNHLLFDRIYGDAGGLVDITAEKIIGIYGNKAFLHTKQVPMIAEFISKYEDDDFIKSAIVATESCLTVGEDVYNRLKEMAELTLGMDDMIMSNASKLEEFIFLLKQTQED
jgi:DNA-binding ferritin-like protein